MQNHGDILISDQMLTGELFPEVPSKYIILF